MHCATGLIPLSLISLAGLLFVQETARADSFDQYTNQILMKVPAARGVKELKELLPEVMVDNNQVLPGITGTFVVVKTNEGRMSKLLVQPARQKVTEEQSVPILLIERFITFQEGEERAVQARGKNVRLFKDFYFNLDLGQVVPKEVGGDLHFVVMGDKVFMEPTGKARLFLVTRHLPEAAPKKQKRAIIGAIFQPQFFTGVYQLYDDGRRSGTLHLKVADKPGEEGEWGVTGSYYSDKDGKKYGVEGKIGNPHHAIQFRITYPRTLQFFQGWMFTGDGRAIAGSSRMQEREAGFYAVRKDSH